MVFILFDLNNFIKSIDGKVYKGAIVGFVSWTYTSKPHYRIDTHLPCNRRLLMSFLLL